MQHFFKNNLQKVVFAQHLLYNQGNLWKLGIWKMETIGERIIKLREKRKISQRGLAIKANVANSTISRLESDINIPQGQTLESLAKALNVSPGYILTGEDRKPIKQEYPEKYKRIIEMIVLLNDADMQLVESVVKNLLDRDKEEYEKQFNNKASNK